MELLEQRYAREIAGKISCFDRMIIAGNVFPWCFAKGMSAHLGGVGVRIFDYPKFAQEVRNEISRNAEKIARKNGIEIEFVRKSSFRKEDLVAKAIQKRGEHTGLVCILSAMEGCASYSPWHDKASHTTFLKPRKAQCLHYYFYFIDAAFGLCYVRVPTWCPCRLQVYFNGHNWLERQLIKKRIPYKMKDNAFVEIADFNKAQQIVDSFKVKELSEFLNRSAKQFCPVVHARGLSYNWTIVQAEYATDIVFGDTSALKPLYERLVRTAIHTVKPGDIATFLSKRLTSRTSAEVGNRFSTRIEGTRIKHTFGALSVKMYDKFGSVLRIEATVNDASLFSCYRTVVHRNGERSRCVAPLRKSIFSLPSLAECMSDTNKRYEMFISSFDDITAGIKKLEKLSAPVEDNCRNYRGFNMFDKHDHRVLQTIAQGDFVPKGFRNKDLRSRLGGSLSNQATSRLIRRLRLHGIVKKASHSYNYYLTSFGREVTTTGLALKELFITPRLAGLHSAV